MLERTRRLWERQQRLVGDRRRLFGVVAEAVDATTVLYPGSYVDLTPSFLWPTVTYVDVDRRSKQFFDDVDGIQELLGEHRVASGAHTVNFIHADYTSELEVPVRSIDLLVSLYAGFISEHCTRYLRPGGSLLVNPSHGDAAMASIDDRYRLRGVVLSDGDDHYRLETADLDAHLVPKRAVEITAELLHDTGRGVVYTRSAFAYLFERVD